MLSKYSSAVGGVTRIFMSASQTEMHTLSVVSVLISGRLTDGCMHSRPLAVKRSEFVKHVNGGACFTEFDYNVEDGKTHYCKNDSFNQRYQR